MAKQHYVAVLERGEKGSFGVFFPDLPGCVSAGHSAEEAMRDAREALALHVEAMAEDGLEVSPPSSIHAWGEGDFPESVVETLFLVPVDVPEAPPKEPPQRVNISLPGHLINRIDNAAEYHGLTRSGLLALAARQWISANRGEGR